MAKHKEIVLPNSRITGRIGIRERVRHWNKTTANDPKQLPLLSRGWVLQEWLLSRRILHFCSTELIWECRESSICECEELDQKQSPGAVFHNLTKTFDETRVPGGRLAIVDSLPSLWARVKARAPSSRSRTNRLSSPQLGMPPTALIHNRSLSAASPRLETVRTPEAVVEDIPDYVFHYHRLVEQYSALQLTRATDCLTAFSGLTERMQHFLADHLAGLWSDSLCFDLMWRIDKHALWDSKSTRPKDYIGPFVVMGISGRANSILAGYYELQRHCTALSRRIRFTINSGAPHSEHTTYPKQSQD